MTNEFCAVRGGMFKVLISDTKKYRKIVWFRLRRRDVAVLLPAKFFLGISRNQLENIVARVPRAR